MSFAIFDTGVLAFECCFINLMSPAVYSLRAAFFLFPLANSFSSTGIAVHSTRRRVARTVFCPTFAFANWNSKSSKNRCSKRAGNEQ